ncbi:MAG: hypothetical protein ACYC35_08740 [Pirellulales bacterium]
MIVVVFIRWPGSPAGAVESGTGASGCWNPTGCTGDAPETCGVEPGGVCLASTVLPGRSCLLWSLATTPPLVGVKRTIRLISRCSPPA